MAYPFSRLRTDRFWHRIPKPGYDPDIEYNVSSMERLQEMYFGAKIDDERFAFMTQPNSRDHLRMVLKALAEGAFFASMGSWWERRR